MTPLEPTARVAVRAYVLLTLTALGWAANTVLAQLAVGEVSPLALVALRWGVVSLLLLVFARRSLRDDWAVVRPRLPFLAAMGALGFTAFNGLYYTAAHFTSALNMGIVQGSVPVLVVAGAFALDRVRITLPQGLGVAMSLLGVVVVASAGDASRVFALVLNPGDVLMVCACILYAGYTLALRRGPAVSAFGLLTVMATAAFVASLPLLAAEWASGKLQWPTASGWLIVISIAVVPSLLAQAGFIRGVQLIGPERAGLFVNLVPVFAAILAVVFLSEAVEPFHGVALCLVLAGIGLSERRA